MDPIQTTKPRDYSLDILKIIAIFMVCLYHYPLNNISFGHLDSFSFENFINTLLFMTNAVCIPLFFMVNGALLLNKPVKIKSHLKKCGILLISHYVFRTLTILLIGAFNCVDFSSIDALQWIKAIFLFESFPGVEYNHFWFIPTLISIYFIYPFINLIFFNEDKNTHSYIFCFLFILLCFMLIGGDFVYIQKCLFNKVIISTNNIQNLNPFELSKSGYLFYFILGGVILKYKDKLKTFKWQYLVLIFIIGLSILFCYWHFQYTTWDYVFNAYNLMPTILMTTALFLICLKIPNEKIANNKILSHSISLVGSNTISIYYTHWILCYCILSKIAYLLPFNILTNFIKALLLVLLGVLIGILIKKLPIFKHLVT